MGQKLGQLPKKILKCYPLTEQYYTHRFELLHTPLCILTQFHHVWPSKQKVTPPPHVTPFGKLSQLFCPHFGMLSQLWDFFTRLNPLSKRFHLLTLCTSKRPLLRSAASFHATHTHKKFTFVPTPPFGIFWDLGTKCSYGLGQNPKWCHGGPSLAGCTWSVLGCALLPG